MSPAVEDFQSTSSSSSTHRQYFQNPNPSAHKHPTDSGIFNSSFNLTNSIKLDFDCSNDAAAAAAVATATANGRSSRRKHAKVRKQSSCVGSVSAKSVDSTGNVTDFVFNASLGQVGSGVDGEKQSVGEFLDVNMMRFSMGATDGVKLEKKMNSEEVQNSGNNLNFVFGVGGKADSRKGSEIGSNKFGKPNGVDFVFGVKMNNGVMSSNSSNIGRDNQSGGTVGRSGVDEFVKVNEFTTKADSNLVNSLSGLNLGTKGPSEVEHLSDKLKREENNNTSGSEKTETPDFVFSANCGDIRTDLNYQKEKLKEKVGKLVPDGNGEMKLDADVVFGTSGDSGTATEGVGKKDLKMNSTEIKSGDSINSNVDSGIKFSIGKDNGVFHIGNQNEKKSSFKGSRKLKEEVNILKSEGTRSNIDSVRDGKYSFNFGSNLGNSFGGIPESKVYDETERSNIHHPTKVSTANKINDSDRNSCSYFNNSFVFGSDKRNISCGRSDATSLNQCSCVNSASVCSCRAAYKTDEVNKVPAFGVPNGEPESSGFVKKQSQPVNQNEKNSDGGQCYQDQPRNEAELVKETVPSSSSFSTTGLGSAVPIFGAGNTNNFSFQSKFGGFGTSYTGFNTPDINLSTSFTSDMFPGLGKKLEFSKSKSVSQRKLKKTKTKLRHPGGHTHLNKEVPQSFEESSGCSPMDVSPYGVNDCASTSQIPNEDAVDATEEINLSSSSATSFADADVLARRRANQKKYKMKTGKGLEFKTPKSRVNVSRAHESTNREHAKASDHEICDKWRKRGNQAYKNGLLSEAEVCYSKGISSIQHTETTGVCIEPLLLCYSNRAAARMALGRMREGLKDCRMTAALDPNFIKANLRSANCHLLLGELEDAHYNYNKCVEFDIVLDRRIAIEAADGLQKTQRVTDYLKQSAELLQQKTYESATSALKIISDALSISCYSEKLLNMKGEALNMLGKHKEVVQLCEQTLDSAEKNFDSMNSLKLWRWKLMSKSYFHLGRLEMALDLVEKHEQLRPTVDTVVGSEDSLAPLAVTIRELLHCKNAGNEAFQSGMYTEAVEHYTAAISKSIESHSFAAVCFCNRAAAHQSLGEISDAIGDCSIAIALDGSYQKALSRRATLWEMIRDYKHAADDLQRLISILELQSGETSRKSPTPGKSTNGSVKDLRRARRRLSSLEENAKKERSLDLYLILGIKPSDTAAEVKKAYRKAALRHHPDKAGKVFARAENGCDGQQWKVIAESIQMDADRLFKMIGEAYAVLSDPTKRSKYDLEEEMWDDMNTNVGCSSSSRRASDYYSSPFETSNRRNSHDSRKTYSNSSYYYWEDPRKTYNGSYSRW